MLKFCDDDAEDAEEKLEGPRMQTRHRTGRKRAHHGATLLCCRSDDMHRASSLSVFRFFERSFQEQCWGATSRNSMPYTATLFLLADAFKDSAGNPAIARASVPSSESNHLIHRASPYQPSVFLRSRPSSTTLISTRADTAPRTSKSSREKNR